MPLSVQQLIEVQWLCKQAQCQIGNGQINYEYIPRSAHVRVFEHHKTHESVAKGAKYDHYGEDSGDDNLCYTVKAASGFEQYFELIVNVQNISVVCVIIDVPRCVFNRLRRHIGLNNVSMVTSHFGVANLKRNKDIG